MSYSGGKRKFYQELSEVTEGVSKTDHPRSKHFHLLGNMISQENKLSEVLSTKLMCGPKCSTDHEYCERAELFWEVYVLIIHFEEDIVIMQSLYSVLRLTLHRLNPVYLFRK